jgi:hypothetical protein
MASCTERNACAGLQFRVGTVSVNWQLVGAPVSSSKAKYTMIFDICAAVSGISPVRIAAPLGYCTSGRAYLSAYVDGTPRIDLDGRVAGTVTAEQATSAQGRLK